MFKPSGKDKDSELKRALAKDPSHLDPFVQAAPTLSNKIATDKTKASGRLTGDLSTLPYWGVSVGAGLVVGGPVAWGLSTGDVHCLDHAEQAKRGACAVGVGVLASTKVAAYCNAGLMGSCKSRESSRCGRPLILRAEGVGVVTTGCMGYSDCLAGIAGSDGAGLY